MTPTHLRLFIRMSRPVYLLIGVLLFVLGMGIGRYLGFLLDWNVYLLGQAWALMLQLGLFYLLDYFEMRPDEDSPRHNVLTSGSGNLGPGKLPRAVSLWAAFLTLTVTASLSVLLINRGDVTPALLVPMSLLVIGALVYTVPPIRLADTGYGELVLSIWMAYLLPTISFLLQSGENHRLMAMTTFPLTALFLAMILTREFADYARDVKFVRLTLLSRMGWQNGMTVHNLLVLSAYLLLVVAAFFGLPRVIILPALVTLPLGLFEIWQLVRIGAGVRPNWRVLILTSTTLFLLIVYLLTYAFWTR